MSDELLVSGLASGSSGNAFYCQGANGGLLIDTGITCKQVCDRLALLGKNISSIKGIFITHEHGDHVRGLDVLSRKFGIPVFMSNGTYKGLKFNLNPDLVRIVEHGDEVEVAGSIIKSFSKKHDAREPLSFTVDTSGKKASFVTDAGIVCDNIKGAVAESDILVMEANHDIEMLQNGPYPYFLKNRVGGDEGHLSNYDAALCVLQHADAKLKHLVLGHLSLNNNTEEKAVETFKAMVSQRTDLAKVNICLSGRKRPTELFGLR